MCQKIHVKVFLCTKDKPMTEAALKWILSHLPAIRITSITVRIIHMSEGFYSSSTDAESKFSAHVDLLPFKQENLCIRGALLIAWSS